MSTVCLIIIIKWTQWEWKALERYEGNLWMHWRLLFRGDSYLWKYRVKVLRDRNCSSVLTESVRKSLMLTEVINVQWAAVSIILSVILKCTASIST